jgi:hypothetical protein
MIVKEDLVYMSCLMNLDLVRSFVRALIVNKNEFNSVQSSVTSRQRKCEVP